MFNESMRLLKVFNTVKECLQYICDTYKDPDAIFGIDDIKFSFYCFDDRLDTDTYLVTVNVFYNDNRITPSKFVIGYLFFK
jgi:hypothetical protein